jgi:hypothetical protein
MELLLKVHDKASFEFRAFQDKYQNANIGFEKLFELEAYGILARDKEIPQEIARVEIKEEIRRGRYPLVSLPSAHIPGRIVFHVFIAVLDGESLRFLSRGYNEMMPLDLKDDAVLSDQILRLNGGLIKFCYYQFKEINSVPPKLPVPIGPS